MFKINTTFALMKIRRSIYFKIFLLIVLFLFPVINAYSNFDTQRYFIEISPATDNNESKLTLDFDSSDEDQIDQSNKSDLPEQPDCQKIHLCILPLYSNLFLSVWQPPKIF
jgi:hypothetical protein